MNEKYEERSGKKEREGETKRARMSINIKAEIWKRQPDRINHLNEKKSYER